ncbi:MAG: hypothetical protein INF84_10795 [Roseomonas sp.]|nr:hypothetical protein [Roseomonas sp.]
MINFMTGGAVATDLWEIRSVKASSKSVTKSVDRTKGASIKPKIVAAVDSKSVAKKIHQTATKATRIPEKPTTTPPTRGKSLKPPKIRKEDFNFSVTPEFRKKFKKAAKDAGHKKAEFLQILLASWQDRGPSKAEAKA